MERESFKEGIKEPASVSFLDPGSHREGVSRGPWQEGRDPSLWELSRGG